MVKLLNHLIVEVGTELHTELYEAFLSHKHTEYGYVTAVSNSPSENGRKVFTTFFFN